MRKQPSSDSRNKGTGRDYKKDNNRGTGSGFKGSKGAGEKRGYGKEAGRGEGRKDFDRPARFNREDKADGYKRSENRDGEKRPYNREGSDKPGGYKRSENRSDFKPSFKRDDRNGGYKRTEDGGDRKRPFNRDENSDRKRPFKRNNSGDRKFERPDRDRKRFDDKGEEKRPYNREGNERKPYGRSREDRKFEDREKKPYRKDDNKENNGEPPVRKSRRFEDMDLSFGKDSERNKKAQKPPRKKEEDFEQFEEVKKPKPVIKKAEDADFTRAYPLGARKVSGPFRKKFEEEQAGKRAVVKRERRSEQADEAPEIKEMTLNKYISHSGECSRRDAAEMVKQGKVKVNGELMLDPGYRVQPYDKVTIAGKKLSPIKDRVYILLNKPKGFITTTEDPEGRKTVMELVANSGAERLFPVGRLDRNTTGLLLMTNDGDLAQKLSHPSYEIKKVYQVTLNKPLTKVDFEKIVSGLELEDGPVQVDALAYLDSKEELGLEIHSGKNRIVRRIFESLGYEVEKLDRVMYAGLTKKNLPRGKWRTLDDKEIILLKHFKV